MTFYRLVFRLPFQTALERNFFALGIQKSPRMEPKPSQNPVENASEIDLMLRTLKSESEQTLPHFCSFLPLQAPRKWFQTRLRNSFPLGCSKKLYKNRFCFPFSSVLASKLAPTWPPKTHPKSTKTFKIYHKNL